MATSVQYGIRHLMVLTLVVAVVMAVLGPTVRVWDTERRFVFMVCLAAAVLPIVGATCLLCMYRFRVERAAGDVLLRISTFDGPEMKCLLVALVAGCGALIIAGSIVFSGVWKGGGYHSFVFVWLVVCPFIAIPPLMTRLWWGLHSRSIEVCKHGFVLGAVRFLSYSELKHYRWSRYFPNRLIIIRKFRKWEREERLRIPLDMRDEVGRLLKQHGVRQFDGGGGGAHQY